MGDAAAGADTIITGYAGWEPTDGPARSGEQATGVPREPARDGAPTEHRVGWSRQSSA